MTKKALTLALEALEKCDSALAEELTAWDIDPPLHHVLEASNACGLAITAIKEALMSLQDGEQTDQEPVATAMTAHRAAYFMERFKHEEKLLGPNEQAALDFVISMLEAKPEQEPLEYWNAVEGWVKLDEVREHFDSVGCGTIYKTAGEGREPLYTTPPKRTWVGLTQQERDEINEQVYGAVPHHIAFHHAIEAKLKEKNT